MMRGLRDRGVLISGGTSGIGLAAAERFLEEGCRVFVGGVDADALAAALERLHPGGPVEGVRCDVSDEDGARALVEAGGAFLGRIDVLINNAGIALYDDLTDRSVLERQLGVNLFGPYEVIQAFLPQLTRSRGAIVNNLSINAFAPLPVIPAYSISKAAAFSLTQALRALLAGRGVRVHAVLTGPTDTDMNRGFDIPKASPESVARAIFDGVERGEEEIFPDPVSQSMAESWRGGATKALERQFAAVAETVAVPGA
jgi:NAD(P)-dependent dehydrogenase (short-subunit alcohol dehydrogenase family)